MRLASFHRRRTLLLCAVGATPCAWPPNRRPPRHTAQLNTRSAARNGVRRAQIPLHAAVPGGYCCQSDVCDWREGRVSRSGRRRWAVGGMVAVTAALVAVGPAAASGGSSTVTAPVPTSPATVAGTQAEVAALEAQIAQQQQQVAHALRTVRPVDGPPRPGADAADADPQPTGGRQGRATAPPTASSRRTPSTRTSTTRRPPSLSTMFSSTSAPGRSTTSTRTRPSATSMPPWPPCGRTNTNWWPPRARCGPRSSRRGPRRRPSTNRNKRPQSATAAGRNDALRPSRDSWPR